MPNVNEIGIGFLAASKFEWHYEASNEVVRLVTRTKDLLKKMAEDAAVIAPFAPGLEFVVQREHVISASRSLFAGEHDLPGAVLDVRPFVFISYSSRDVEFVADLRKDFAPDDTGSSG